MGQGQWEMLPTPYYEADGITLYCGDNRTVLPHLGRFDLLLTDPPYGIQRDCGMGVGGFGLGGRRVNRVYDGDWDNAPPETGTFQYCLSVCQHAIIWGGNYFSDSLPQKPKWLVWDKQQTMPSYSDAELAWTSLDGVAVKMFRYSGNGLLAKEKERNHPTQKPLSLMTWCLGHAPEAKTVLDPWAGSGTTLVAAKLRGLKAVGIEINEQYCELAVSRLAQRILIAA